MKWRKGVSMVEVLAAVTLSTIVLSALGLVLNRTLDYCHAAGRSAGFQRTVARLSRTFRDDVHRASQFSINDATLTLKRDGERTVYDWSGHLLTRNQPMDGRVHRDEFLFPACCAGQFAIKADPSFVPGQRFVQLSIVVRDPSLRQTDPLPNTTSPQTIVITAALNRDEMLAAQERTPTPGAAP